MKCTVITDKSREEEVIVYVHEKNSLSERIEKLAAENVMELVGRNNGESVVLELCNVHYFTVENNKIYALTDKEKLILDYRLYQLEQKLGKNFVKINKSCLANIRKIARFKAEFSGTLKVVFKNGHSDYVSRRQLKNVKERFGL